MVTIPTIAAPDWLLSIANNLYDMERKISKHGDAANIQRNVDKIKERIGALGVVYEDPMGQPFRETRTDLDATIAGTGTENLVVVEVIKPIIRMGAEGLFTRVVQKGIVVVESSIQGGD